MSYHFPPLPTPAEQVRADGWSPARQRQFLETLAATGVITTACDAVHISPRAAYALRIRRDGAAFRLGWDAAILIARARLADDLLARALNGHEEVIHKDDDTITRRRHDNRLAMSMLSRLDRMADSPPEGSDAALARVVAQDFAAYLDLICPEEEAQADRASLPPLTAPDDDSDPLDPAGQDSTPAIEQVATAISPGASAALFVAARMALGGQEKAPPSLADERCELPPQVYVDPATLPPEQAATRLRGVWWDDDKRRLRTDYPAPPGFAGDQTDDIYDIGRYQRDLTEEEMEALAIIDEAERRPYEDAATRARDLFFGFMGHDMPEESGDIALPGPVTSSSRCAAAGAGTP